ncbi:hypothetical protein HYPSUDRAFT_202873 [Hypholoma sublateritium FD-334 SS-4]|uniref:Aminoglycoside phosphotransferase domain-containing protein n=1 Tax=Hypholoma sublateritium (strain FD-334 SS-4) TaxID=945553 RepID=A0A0D2MDB3_HYPSF|nr:hypothetical protein HYPSUDRAFT_202873 [Hypholoma sublateritium FD-334 SS-4]
MSEMYVWGTGTDAAAANIDKQLNNCIESLNYYLNSHVTGLSGSISLGSCLSTSILHPRPTVTSADKKPHPPTSPVPDHSVMHQNGRNLFIEDLEDSTALAAVAVTAHKVPAQPPLTWDWAVEHEDRKRERKSDAASHEPTPFEVDRKILKDVVREKMGVEVGRIRFLNSGTFHKAYLVTLVDHVDLVARVARRFMPRLKIESEVATISYLRHKTNIPVSTIYHYDSNPYNRLGGEFILMSKAPGIPLSQVYHGLSYGDLVKLMKNVAAIILPLFAHRFQAIGSLYFGPEPSVSVGSGSPTPKALSDRYSAFPFSPTLDVSGISAILTPKPSFVVPSALQAIPNEYHIGPIISWPFFGSNRGELTHPAELNRGPWPTTQSYLASCVTREIDGVIRENEGKSAPHRLHLDPDEIISSRHHRVRAVPGDESDESDEWNLSESEDEWEGPGDVMYRDYRRMQRSTFLVAHMVEREEKVRKEMGRWMSMMERLTGLLKTRDGPEEFGLDCHDLSLENIFVDEKDHTTITSIIDWESTTTRPLWACAHVPAFLQSSPFLTKLFREIVAKLPTDPTVQIQLPPAAKNVDLSELCREWLHYETSGTRLRMAHRCAEWDGWEEGLVDSILGPEDFEAEWFRHGSALAAFDADLDASIHGILASTPGHESTASRYGRAKKGAAAGARGAVPKLSSKLPMLEEQEKEQMLNTTGDICGGRGGELGRRLEAWLTVSGNMRDIHSDAEGGPVDVEAR